MIASLAPSPAEVIGPPLLLNPADAAVTLAISPRKLWSLTAGGEIVACRVGRCVRYERREIEAFIHRSRETHP